MVLAACGPRSERTSPPEMIAAARYTHDGPPAITLFTMVSNRSDYGAHLGMMVNGSQRVIFDPAGDFEHPSIAERGDVIFGVTPLLKRFYVGVHARETYRVVGQRLEVSPEVAEQALRLVLANGSVPAAQCALSITNILAQLPGFDGFRPGYFPNKARAQFGAIPGVVETVHIENDPDDKLIAISEYRLAGEVE